MSIQFTSLSEPQVEQLEDFRGMPSNIATYINSFDTALDEETFKSTNYSYRIFYVPKIANSKGQADKVVTFIKEGSKEAEQMNVDHVLIKEREKKKMLPCEIVKVMKSKGYTKINMYHFVKCWKMLNAKKDNSYGVQVANTWYWYESFIPVIEQYCKNNNLK